MDGRIPPIPISEPEMSHPMMDVDSSAVSRIGWDSETDTLYVQWKTTGMTYLYLDVSQAEYEGVVGAASIGSHMNRIVKKKKYCIAEGEF